MQTVTRVQLATVLTGLGIGPGDGLLVHSAIQYLGRPEGGVGMYLDALADVLDFRVSSLAVPSFNFAFARGEPYDPLVTPSVGMGAFAEHVRQDPRARRTPHPMQSLAVIGNHAGDLAACDTSGAFDDGSAFERLLDLDFKLLLLGADVQAVSMLHYSEQRAHVPYRYWKDFTGSILTPRGWQARNYRMFVRDLDMDPHIELYPIQSRLQERGQWRETALNYGKIAVCRLVDFVSVVDEFLETDPWSLVANRPGGIGPR
jgi:aminoglycoside 3-N-acetyltransferase